MSEDNFGDDFGETNDSLSSDDDFSEDEEF